MMNFEVHHYVFKIQNLFARLVMNKLFGVFNNRMAQPNSEQSAQECDATDVR